MTRGEPRSRRGLSSRLPTGTTTDASCGGSVRDSQAGTPHQQQTQSARPRVTPFQIHQLSLLCHDAARRAGGRGERTRRGGRHCAEGRSLTARGAWRRAETGARQDWKAGGDCDAALGKVRDLRTSLHRMRHTTAACASALATRPTMARGAAQLPRAVAVKGISVTDQPAKPAVTTCRADRLRSRPNQRVVAASRLPRHVCSVTSLAVSRGWSRVSPRLPRSVCFRARLP